MTQADLVERVLKEAEPGAGARLTRKAIREVLFVSFALIEGAVKKTGRFEWDSFGVFMLRPRKARIVRNPSTKKLMRLPATLRIGFRSAWRR